VIGLADYYAMTTVMQHETTTIRVSGQYGIDNKIILADFDKPPSEGAIECRSRLGGMLNYYYRKAA
jgi:hypothetical protein